MINNIVIVGFLILDVPAVIYGAILNASAPIGNVPLIYKCDGINCVDSFTCIEYDPANGAEKGSDCKAKQDSIIRYDIGCYWYKFNHIDKGAKSELQIFRLPIRWCNGPDKVGVYHSIAGLCTLRFMERKELEHDTGIYYDDLEDCQRRQEKAISALPILFDCNGKDCPVGRCVFYDKDKWTINEDVDCENNKYTFLKQSASKAGCQLHKYKNYKSVSVEDLDVYSCGIEGRYYGYDFKKECAVRWFYSEEQKNSDEVEYDDDFFYDEGDCLEKLNSRCGPKEESKNCYAACSESSCKEIREKKRRKCPARPYICDGRLCVCIDGHVRDDNGNCIPENQCPWF